MRKLALSCLLLCGVMIAADERNFSTWSTFSGGADASQYSSLKQVNKANVKQLQVAWTYPTGGTGTFIFNPIVVDGTMYVLKAAPPPPAPAGGAPPAGGRGGGGGGGTVIAALDAATGKELWAHPNP